MDEETRNGAPPDGDGASTEDSSAPVDASSEGAPRTRLRWRRVVKAASVTLVALVLVGLGLLSQTAEGHRLVLDEFLSRIRGSLAGELSVGGIRSRTLLFGLTLTDVRLDAAGDRPVLVADSVVVRYSPLSLILGNPRVRSTTIHGMDLEISKYPGDDFLNVERILAPGAPADSLPPRYARTIALGRIAVRRGTIRVLTPSQDEPGLFTVPAPNGGTLDRLEFDGVDLDLEETILRPGGALALDARLASLTMSVFLRKEPLVIHEARGELNFGAQGLRIRNAAFRMPGSLIDGDVTFGPDRPGAPWILSATLRSDGWGDLKDLHWIDARIPPGRFRGGAELHVQDGIDVTLRGLETQLEASTLVASGRAHFGDELTVDGMQLTVSPLVVSRLEPWIGRDIPLDGFLSGRATFTGSFDALQTTGRLTLIPTGMGGGSSTADFSGTVHLGDDPGATNLTVQLDPLNYRVLETWWADADALGSGRARLELNGRVDEGFMFVADFVHSGDRTPASRATGTGLLRRGDDGRVVADVRGELTPLSLPLLGRVWPDLRLRGEVAGPVHVQGPLDDLHVTGDLEAGYGHVVLDGTMDFTAPGSSYQLRADAEALRLSEITDRVPEPSVLSGRVTVEGSSFALDSIHASATLDVRDSRIGAARIDSVAATIRAADGILTMDTVVADVSGVRFSGGGSLGLVEGSSGAARFDFDVASLLNLRPIFMGDSLLIREELNPLEQDLLRARGIEPDTLPTELDVRMAGSARGTAAVSGRVGDVGLDLVFEMADAAYGPEHVDSASVSLSATGLPATFGDWRIDARASGVTWSDRQFEAVHLDGNMSQRRGDGTLDIQRRGSERYFMTGAFALDSVGGQVDLQEASVEIQGLAWTLQRPTRIAWDSSSVSVDSLQFDRVGEDPMHLVANGTVTRGGDSDFRLDMEGFHVEHAMQIAQREDIDVAGHLDLSLTVQGPAERPIVNGLFQVESPRYRGIQLSRMSGSLQYEDRTSTFRVDAWDGSRSVLTAAGTLPIDLALSEVQSRTLDEPMDVEVTADSLDARIALGYLETLKDVAGTVSADVHIGGTSRQPEPSGEVQLHNGAWTIEALGVRHTGLTGDLVLRPDRTVTVKLTTTRGGTSAVTGVVTMVPVSDPELDLLVTFDHFQAVARRDVESMISGQFRVTGRYSLPVAEGSLTLDQGTLFVEEFARASGVVDLTDPTLYADGLAVDTTVFVSQPLIASIRNPFVDNLRVDIDLSVPRDMWLRSDEMNVEIGGELQVRYDRRQNDLVLIGDLQALRGSYLVLGRTFDVDEGTVSFIGQPGINPSLNIQATSRIRRREEEPLDVIATVQGTLVQPLVTLSTEETGLSQSDLVSYLVFGRPSGAMGNFGRQTALGGVTYLTGALASQIGAALQQEIGVIDYLSISQGAALDTNATLSATATAQTLFGGTQVEVGRYLTNDVFVVLVFGQPANGPSGGSDTGGFSLRGLRIDFPTDLPWIGEVSVEGFVEDPFLRSGIGGLGTTGLEGGKIVGAFVFHDWGYGSRR